MSMHRTSPLRRRTLRIQKKDELLAIRDYGGVGVSREKWDTMGSKSRSSWSKINPSMIQPHCVKVTIPFQFST